MNNTKSKIVLLTGAGFSTGFLTYGKHRLCTKFLTDLLTNPSTFKEFFEIVSTDLTNTDDLNRMLKIQEVCTEIFVKLDGKIKGLNFEHIIFALEKICDTRKANALDSRNIEQIISASVLCTKYTITYEDLHALNCFILDVVSLFKRTDQTKTSWNTIHPSIKKFKTYLNDNDTHHFTLNYDTCFYNSPLNFQGENSNEIIECNFENIKSHHLHGSVLFSRTGMFLNLNVNLEGARSSRLVDNYLGKNISYFQPNSSSNDEAYFFSSVIGLGKSSKLLNPIYDWMWQKFVCEFNKADKLIIIGYSFNDAHINSILKYVYSINSLKTIHVVDKKDKGRCESMSPYDSENQEFEERVSNVFLPGRYQSYAPKEKPHDVELKFFSEGAEKYMESYE